MNNIFTQLNYIKIYLQARNFSMFNYHIKSLNQFCMILDNKEVNTAINDLEEKVRFWTKDKTSEVKKSYVKK